MPGSKAVSKLQSVDRTAGPGEGVFRRLRQKAGAAIYGDHAILVLQSQLRLGSITEHIVEDFVLPLLVGVIQIPVDESPDVEDLIQFDVIYPPLKVIDTQ